MSIPLCRASALAAGVEIDSVPPRSTCPPYYPDTKAFARPTVIASMMIVLRS